MTEAAASTGTDRRGIDPRGPRFVASLTAVVLAAAVVTGNVWILLVQAVLFGIGAFAGIQRTPYSWLYRTLVRPRLGPPSELEDPKPPQFAQGSGCSSPVSGWSWRWPGPARSRSSSSVRWRWSRRS